MIEQVDIESISKKFSDFNYPDRKVIEEQLSRLNTISDKLDHLRSVEKEFYTKFQEIKSSFSEAERDLFLENETVLLNSIFGSEKLITPLFMPESIFDEYFKTVQDTAEYRYWFLRYMAEKRFDKYLNSKIYKDSIELNFTENLQNEFVKIIDVEEKAFRLLREEKIDFYNNTKNEKGFLWASNDKEFVDSHNYEGNSVEVLRVLKNYYKKYPTASLYDWASKEVDAYYRHVLLKPHLESILDKEVKGSSVPIRTLALIAYVQQEIKEIKRLVHQKDVIAYGKSLGVSGNHFKNVFVKINSSNGTSGFNKDHYEEALELLSKEGREYATKRWQTEFN
ncbi:hypothetical protein M0D21_10165 [Aquimarina sp. D1M17]|uniref:hypothetical protein n=1 Tax=Aquimarina acroporae TaxID=2937283 RepID=UPI0020C10402|nr:hypothetical protein [Aquimarina acroporae]MCK8521933.1 hypothetical protein [Aquimarina acroporae]